MIITLKDGSKKEYAEAKSVIDIAADISEGLARVACAGEVDGEVVDLRHVVDKDCELSILTFEDEGGKGAFRHTTSHIMAQAIKRLYPDVKLAIGPSIADGFYYDIDSENPITTEDLAKIEVEMKKVVKEALPITRFTKSREEAIAFFKEKNEPYKVELIEDLPEGEEISFYSQGDWTDLCAGPHLMSVKGVKAFKLLSSSSAYWRGSEKNAMLTRIYGTAYATKDELKEHLEQMEEAKKRDHRKLGKELGLFMMREEGPGFPFFLPKGMVLKNTLLDYWREIHQKAGYVEISTPIMLSRHLWETSGHWDHYKENMYTTVIDDQDFAIKPMNCPGGILVYQSEPRSYRDLPLRMGELGLVHRHEKSGQLHGLMRVRCFTQDDAHIFCRPDQVKQEFLNVMDIISIVFKTMNFENFEAQISLRDKVNREKYIGSDENWEKAEQAIVEACEEKGLKAKIEYGEAAFYGPKLDFMVKDAIGRRWQLGTIQVDYNLPERFQLEYTGADNQKHRPVMIHRAPFGSMERFVAVLIEHTAGKFPLWLTPEQVCIMPISEKFNDYAWQIARELGNQEIRAIVDDRNEKIGRKIRDNELKRIPYMLIVGEKEAENSEVSVRKQGEGDKGSMKIATFAALLNGEVEEMMNRWQKSND